MVEIHAAVVILAFVKMTSLREEKRIKNFKYYLPFPRSQNS